MIDKKELPVFEGNVCTGSKEGIVLQDDCGNITGNIILCEV